MWKSWNILIFHNKHFNSKKNQNLLLLYFQKHTKHSNMKYSNIFALNKRSLLSGPIWYLFLNFFSLAKYSKLCLCQTRLLTFFLFLGISIRSSHQLIRMLKYIQLILLLCSSSAFNRDTLRNFCWCLHILSFL